MIRKGFERKQVSNFAVLFKEKNLCDQSHDISQGGDQVQKRIHWSSVLGGLEIEELNPTLGRWLWRRIQKGWTAYYGNLYKVSKTVTVSSTEGTRKITLLAEIGMDYLDLREVTEEKIDISAWQVRRRQWSRHYIPSSNMIREKVTLPPPWTARQTFFSVYSF